MVFYKSKLPSAKGFTLIELSIVLVIIGLIVAGIMGGQSLIRAAKLRSVTTDINRFKVAITTYKDYYGYLPGDHTNAYDYFDGSGGSSVCGANTIGTATSCNGNGDGRIKFLFTSGTNEDFRSWQHLSLAKMVPGEYSGEDAGSPNYQPDVNIPSSSIGYSGYWLFYYGFYSRAAGNLIHVGGINSKYPEGYFINTADAENIDRKMDDGLADGGNVYTRNAWVGNTEQTTCVTGAFDDPTSSYIMTNTEESCVMIFWLD